MEIPPLNKEILDKMGLATNAITPLPAYDLELNTGKPGNKRPKALTTDECIKLFGVKDAVTMNFVPQMLTALALEQAEAFVDYCRDNRLSEYKKHNREIRKCIEEYNRELFQSYGSAWYSYKKYYERLRNTVEVDLFQCWCVFTNEASRQYIGREHKDIPARVSFVRLLLTFVEELDKNIDKVITQKIKAPCYRCQNPALTLLTVLCIDIAETFSHKMEITDTMAVCVKVLANRCRQVVNEIITEEDAESYANRAVQS